MQTIISENVKRLRKVKELTQRELANLSGVSQSGISRIEDGQNVPTMNTILKLAKALGQTPESLVKGAIEKVECLGEHAGFNLYVSDTVQNQADSWGTVEKSIMEDRIGEARRLVDEALKLANEANVQMVRSSITSFALGLLLGASMLMLIVGLLS